MNGGPPQAEEKQALGDRAGTQAFLAYDAPAGDRRGSRSSYAASLRLPVAISESSSERGAILLVFGNVACPREGEGRCRDLKRLTRSRQALQSRGGVAPTLPQRLPRRLRQGLPKRHLDAIQEFALASLALLDRKSVV